MGSDADVGTAGHDAVVAALRAIAEPTRLRIATVLDNVELTVGELCAVIGQSQPRVSRHLKILCEAGVLDRHREGNSVFYRSSNGALGSSLLQSVASLLDNTDSVTGRDVERLEAVRAKRGEEAAAYFESVASSWSDVRELHVSDDEVEAAVVEAAGDQPIKDLLDIGTGTGRMLELFADRVESGLGIDLSRQMLNLARTNLDKGGHRHCRVRHEDIYDIRLSPGSFDVALLHHVLHFLVDPATAISEAARVLRPGGRLVIVDFAPHELEILRREHAHRRLGFSDEEVRSWCVDADLEMESVRHLEPNNPTGGDVLTTTIWTAQRWPSLALAPDVADEGDVNDMEAAS